MYSECPKCGYRFSWLKKWRLSADRPYPCPACGTGLLKDSRSERWIIKGVFWLLFAQVVLGLLAGAKRIFGFTIPDAIELPLCLLIAVPCLVAGIRYSLKGLRSARFRTVEDAGR